MDSIDRWVVQLQIRISYIKMMNIEIRKLVLGLLFIAASMNVTYIYYAQSLKILIIFGTLLFAKFYLIVVWIKVWNIVSEMLKRAENSETYGTFKNDVANYYPSFGQKYK